MSFDVRTGTLTNPFTSQVSDLRSSGRDLPAAELHAMSLQTVAERLRHASGGLSIAAVSRLTEHHPETVRRYMRGQPASVEFVGRFCQCLGISLEWLILGQGPMRREGALRPDRLTASAS